MNLWTRMAKHGNHLPPDQLGNRVAAGDGTAGASDRPSSAERGADTQKTTQEAQGCTQQSHF